MSGVIAEGGPFTKRSTPSAATVKASRASVASSAPASIQYLHSAASSRIAGGAGFAVSDGTSAASEGS